VDGQALQGESSVKPTALPPGIWYDRERNRYRVRVYSGRRAVHLSYHPDEGSALKTYFDVTDDRGHAGIAALVNPSHKDATFLSVKQFVDKYFTPAERRNKWAKHRVYDWIHSGALPAIKESAAKGAPLKIPAREAYRFARSLQTSANALRKAI
jgi:hypothetical protein